MQKRTFLMILGFSIALCLLAIVCVSAFAIFGGSLPGPSKNVNINYTLRDVDDAEARWEGKKVDTYQIEVRSGGVTPPPPIYILQVWRGQIVNAMSEYRNYDGVHYPGQTPIAADRAQRYSVPGLFQTARDLASAQSSQLTLSGEEIRATFNSEWGYPERMSTFAQCPDCAWSSQVEKFVPFSSAAPPPTPTLRPTSTPTPMSTERP